MARPRRALLRTLALGATLALALTASPAHAATIEDPALASGPLDLKLLEATKHDAGASLRLRLVTYGRWRARLLDEEGPNRISFLFDTDRDGRHDYVGEVFFRDGVLWMRIETAGGRFLRRLRVYHPARNTIRVSVPHGLPNPDGNIWLAATERYWTPTGYCSKTCGDRIPNAGWLKLTPGL
jgi:hypothetical protein